MVVAGGTSSRRARKRMIVAGAADRSGLSNANKMGDHVASPLHSNVAAAIDFLMATQFENNGRPSTAAQVRAFERKIGLSLPADYKNFLRETNGGRPPATALHVPAAKEDVLIDVLFGLGRKPGILGWLAELRRDMPAGFIPIGKDPGGNILIMDLNLPDAGVIYYWDKAHSFQTSTADGNTYPIARSFSRLLELLG